MKKLILMMLIVFSSNYLFAQDKDAIAKMHYINAEDFFNKQTPGFDSNLRLCISELDQAEKALGNTNSKILYLKIKAMDQFALATDNHFYEFDIDSSLQIFFKITDPKNYPEEKYNEIVKISIQFKEKMNTAYQTALQKNTILEYEKYLKEFPSGINAATAKRKLNVLTERKNYIDSIFIAAYKSTIIDFKKNINTPSSFVKDNSDTLITFNNGGFETTQRFALIYKNNNKLNSTFSKESIDPYLDLYINYKLKVFEAKEKDYDKTKEFENEMDGYAVKLISDSIKVNNSNDNLQNELSKYKELILNYYHGILLFNITDNEVWTKAVKDTIGLQMFFDKNKQKYHGSLEANHVIVVAAFQNYLETQWILKLREKYKPVINEHVLMSLIKS